MKSLVSTFNKLTLLAFERNFVIDFALNQKMIDFGCVNNKIFGI